MRNKLIFLTLTVTAVWFGKYLYNNPQPNINTEQQLKTNTSQNLTTSKNPKATSQNTSKETQKEPKEGASSVPVVFITQQTLESSVDQVINKLSTMEDVDSDIVKIRVEHFN